MSQLFIKRDGKIGGPYNEVVIKNSLESGKLTPDDLASTESEGPWSPLVKLLPECCLVNGHPEHDPFSLLEKDIQGPSQSELKPQAGSSQNVSSGRNNRLVETSITVIAAIAMWFVLFGLWKFIETRSNQNNLQERQSENTRSSIEMWNRAADYYKNLRERAERGERVFGN